MIPNANPEFLGNVSITRKYELLVISPNPNPKTVKQPKILIQEKVNINKIQYDNNVLWNKPAKPDIVKYRRLAFVMNALPKKADTNNTLPNVMSTGYVKYLVRYAVNGATMKTV